MGDDTETFNEYKEKLIDYQFTIDQIDLETFENIAQRVSNGLETGVQKSISQIYYNILIDDQKKDSRFKNIRIFKKCIELLNRVNEVIRTELPNDKFKIDREIVLLCMKVVHDHFIPISKDALIIGLL